MNTYLDAVLKAAKYRLNHDQSPDHTLDLTDLRAQACHFVDTVFRSEEGTHAAIDAIATHLWDLGADDQLDQFLEIIGADLEGEPVPVADRPALRDKVANLRLLDRNGCALVTDGSLDHMSDAEVAAIIDQAIATILEGGAA